MKPVFHTGGGRHYNPAADQQHALKDQTMSSVTLFVEVSTDLETKRSGWGAVALVNGVPSVSGGILQDRPPTGTMAELSAVAAALARAVGTGCIKAHDHVTIAMRSTAPLAVLRWVFPEAEFAGVVAIEMPKRLGKQTREAESLIAIDDEAEKMSLKVSLMHVRQSQETVMANGSAKLFRAQAAEDAKKVRRR